MENIIRSHFGWVFVYIFLGMLINGILEGIAHAEGKKVRFEFLAVVLLGFPLTVGFFISLLSKNWDVVGALSLIFFIVVPAIPATFILTWKILRFGFFENKEEHERKVWQHGEDMGYFV